MRGCVFANGMLPPLFLLRKYRHILCKTSNSLSYSFSHNDTYCLAHNNALCFVLAHSAPNSKPYPAAQPLSNYLHADGYYYRVVLGL